MGSRYNNDNDEQIQDIENNIVYEKEEEEGDSGLF